MRNVCAHPGCNAMCLDPHVLCSRHRPKERTKSEPRSASSRAESKAKWRKRRLAVGVLGGFEAW